MSVTFRQLNASIKAQFKAREGFKSAKSCFVGSIPAIRFEGDMPTSLTFAIARWVEINHSSFVSPDSSPQRTIRHISFVEGGVVINWQSV